MNIIKKLKNFKVLFSSKPDPFKDPLTEGKKDLQKQEELAEKQTKGIKGFLIRFFINF